MLTIQKVQILYPLPVHVYITSQNCTPIFILSKKCVRASVFQHRHVQKQSLQKKRQYLGPQKDRLEKYKKVCKKAKTKD